MPPKSLDGDSARAPKVSRATDGKGPFIDEGAEANYEKQNLHLHCGTIFVLRMR